VVYGVCEQCRARVPAEHVIREGKVFLRKDCPDCGTHECMVSSNAAVWQWKRDVYQYDPSDADDCKLDCKACGHDHNPRLLFLDVTNRCNLNCPICIANIPGMGFEYNPSLPYFRKIFEKLGQWESKPRVELFGGEPTVREDLFEIIAIARDNHIPVSVVTNGMRLADEDYCARICETKVDLLMAFDGRDPEIYRRMRGSAAIYEKKLQALENLKKHSRRKHTLVCTLARNLNEHHMADHFQFAHENRELFRRLFFIPLTEMWEPGAFETHVMTTPEDVESILDNAFPGESLEFFPAGLLGSLLPALRFFGTDRIRFAGVHPNCESAAFLVSDGERYRPLSSYLKRPLAEVVADVVTRAKALNPELERLDPKRWFQRLRGRLKAIRAFGGLILGAVDFRKVFRGNRVLGLLSILGGTLRGKSFEDGLARHTHIRDGVPVVVLPFEEWHAVEAGRLKRCTAAFVYLDPDTDELATLPFCIWCFFRKDMFRRISEKYPTEVPSHA